MLVEDNRYIETDGKHPQLEFNISENKFFGNDGCNQINGTIKQLTNSDIIFDMIAATRMRCRNMDDVNKYLELLKKVKHYSISNLELSLEDANNNILLVYRKGD